MSDAVTRWFWLSFVDDTHEKDEFLGVIVMPVTEESIAFIDHMLGDDRFDHMSEDDRAFIAAVQLAAFAQINPGGQVQGFEITNDIDRVPKEQRGRLLSKDELESTRLGRKDT